MDPQEDRQAAVVIDACWPHNVKGQAVFALWWSVVGKAESRKPQFSLHAPVSVCCHLLVVPSAVDRLWEFETEIVHWRLSIGDSKEEVLVVLLVVGAHERPILDVSGGSRGPVTSWGSKRVLHDGHETSVGQQSTPAHDAFSVSSSNPASEWGEASRKHLNGSNGHLYFWELLVTLRNASPDPGLRSNRVLRETVSLAMSCTVVILQLQAPHPRIFCIHFLSALH